MRIGIINVANLTRVRETFHPGWRAVTTIIFLFSVFFWWAAAHQLKSLSPLVEDEALRTRTLVLAAATLIPLTVALFRRNDFARLFFVLALLLNTVTITLLLLLLAVGLVPSVPSWEGMTMLLALIGVLFFLMVYDRYLVTPCYVLSRSLMPFGRWKAYRQQVVYVLRLWSGEWKGVEPSREAGAGERLYPTSGALYRLALGALSFAVGIVICIAAVFGLLNEEFLPAAGRLELSRAWHLLTSFQLTNPTELSTGSWVFQAVTSILVLLLGFFCFFIFGYFRTQWRRENLLIHRTPLLQHMTPSDLLLLRSFSDDVKYVGRHQSIWTLIFKAYSWEFTFEQLIVNRLKYLGQVRLLDVQEEREGLVKKRGLRLIARLLGAGTLRRLLISLFPAVWYRLPAQGGVRYYIKAVGGRREWEEEMEKAMSLARLIVVLLGTTPSLNWEMKRIEQLRLSGKTLFVMPPLILKKNYLARWQRFVELVCVPRGYDRRLLLEKVHPKRVLAVVVRENTLVIITGKTGTQRFYESALDVAALLAVGDPAQSAGMIPKYLA
jgi:hypothetical protein